jgi:glyoxylase-like metal-dependent hydrolase (beta-lactamase superfamily II)
MGAVLELAERMWKGGGGETIGAIQPTFQSEEIADDLHFVHAFANVSALRTEEGLVLVDTGAFLTRSRIFEIVRGFAPERVHTAIYTHGHVDHAFGLPPFLAEAAEKSWQPPRIVGHEAVAARFDRYRRTRGYNACINARQFSLERSLAWPEHYDYPDTVYRDRLELRVGSTRLELHHARGETDDHTWVWWPQRRTVFSGDQFIWVSPNAGNPQKVQRYPEEWAASLREMAALAPELLVPGHGVPILGAVRVRQALIETAEWLESLVQQTLERMNAGETLDAILHEVRPPPELEDRPYLQPVYDDPEYIVRNVWRLYGGWYDGIPSNLKPAAHAALAREVAGLAGGASRLAQRARELAAAGELRLAAHLADWAAAAEPGSSEAHGARAEIYRERTRCESALMSKGVFGAAARDSAALAAACEGGAPKRP